MQNSVSLWRGAVYGSDESGSVFAVSMATGSEIWSTKIQDENLIFRNNGFVTLHDGVVVAASDFEVLGIDAVHGNVLWAFRPDTPTWNLLASYPEDGTVVFQDWTGKAYRCNLADGALIWKSGGNPETWTDGSATVGPNRVVYATLSYGGGGPGIYRPWHRLGGALQAFNLADGTLLWQKEFPRFPNNMPAIGPGRGGGLTVYQPIGQWEQGKGYDVYALDAQTGETQWTFEGPVQVGKFQATYFMPPEVQATISPPYYTNPWSAPTVDPAGAVYIGNAEGWIYRLQDVDGNGRVEGDEVSSFNTSQPFCGSGGAAFAPGLMAIAAADSVWVFRWPEEPAA